MNRHHAFTRRLVDQHRRTVARLHSLPSSLRRLPGVRIDRSLHQVDQRRMSQWTIRPAVRVTIVAPGNQSMPALARHPSKIREVRTVRTIAAVATRHTTVHSWTDTVAVRTLPARTVERSARTVVSKVLSSQITRQPLAVTPPARSHAVLPPVPTTLRRGSSATTEAAVPQTPPAVPGWEITDAAPWTRAPQNPGPPPPADVERLTDQVVAAIDRRLLAHLERTGRGWR
ncbi:hypothetical protein EV652_11819 [Kribbella steppae]|uniref:Uncharacterized protein n=1 Tax=Kribbella steppae TaxID=2512223 RepID=A0A4R2GZW1_9ACTN|nr:hypothetical protein EV652_11819 [Kribbella steppae]